MSGLLKRKRSDSEISFSSSSTLSSPSRPAASIDFSATAVDSDTLVPSIFRARGPPLHLPSRTLKRFRNNRPSDAEVHEHTLSLLYTAQQPTHRQVSPRLEPTLQQDGQHASPSPSRPYGLDHTAPNQPSLHSFWSFPRPVSRHPPLPASPAALYSVTSSLKSVCVDCEATVGNSGDLCMAGTDGECSGR